MELDALGADPAGRADGHAGGEDGVRPAAVERPAVQLLVDRGDRVVVDALVELPLPGQQAVAGFFRQPVEVAGVVGGEVFEAEPAVFHGGEGGGAGQPGEALAAGRPGPQQVEEDLGAGLAGTDDGDVVGGEQPLAVVEVVRRVDHRHGRGLLQRAQRFRYVRLGADADDQVAGVGAAQRLGLAVLVEPGVVDLEAGAGRVPAHRVDLLAEVGVGQVLGDPAAVGVVLGAVDVEAFGEIEREEALAALQPVQERPAAGRVDERHQVGEEGHLQGGAVDEQPGVPVEGGPLVVEGGGEPLDAVGQRGQRQVERADADPEQVVRHVGAGPGRRGPAGASAGAGSSTAAGSAGSVISWGGAVTTMSSASGVATGGVTGGTGGAAGGSTGPGSGAGAGIGGVGGFIGRWCLPW